MLIPVLLFIVGLLCLIKGGDWFVDGATGIARRFKVPELLIGATVVSIGTTLPEVMVSTTSAMTGHGEIAYGNAIGSVICNAALIAAITIAVRPGKVDPKSLRVPVLFFFVAAALYAGVAYTTGYFSRPIGIVLLAMFVAYMVCNVLAMKNAPAPEDDEDEPEKEMSFAKEIGLLILGAALIAVGANLLVDNGTLIAQALGVPESVIALTFVALDYLSGKGPRLPLAGQCHWCQRVQSGAGQRHVHHGVAFQHPAELHHHGHQFLSGHGSARDVRGHAPPDRARSAQGQALPLAGHAAALHLCSLLRRPVCNVSLCAGDPARLHAGAGALGQKTVLRKASSFCEVRGCLFSVPAAGADRKRRFLKKSLEKFHGKCRKLLLY